jgi:diguanylate cyclase (GGDEF)-like protein
MDHVLRDTLRRVRPPELSAFLLLPLLYYLGAKFGASFTVMPEGMVILWPPNSVLLSALILFRGRHFVPFALLAIGAEIAADMGSFQLVEALLFGLINVAEAWIAFVLLARWHFDPRFAALEDVSKFVVAGPLVGAFTAALLGAAVYSYFRGTQTGYLEFLRIWWFGDALGLMIFTPLLLSLWPGAGVARPTLSAIHPADVIIGLVALAALGFLIASRNGMLFGMHVGPVLLLPFVIFVAARFTLRAAAFSVGLVAMVVIVMVTHGNNPFGDQPALHAVVQVQEFIFILSLLALGLAALLTQLRAKQREIQLANQHLSALNRDLEVRVAERTTELSALNTQLTHLALTDSLTGLLNRRAFFDAARREIEHSKRHGRPLAVMILDLDHFKSINDGYGHQAGDRVLQQTATLIGGVIRATDTLARYGGEEFVLLAPETDLESAITLGVRILQTLRTAAILSKQGSIRVTASLGTTVRYEGEEKVEQLLRRADEALYAAKAGGRDQLVAIIANQPPRVVYPQTRSLEIPPHSS